MILSSAAAGRLLGQAVHSPQTVEVLEDLLSVGSGIDLVEREVGPARRGWSWPGLPRPSRSSPSCATSTCIRFDDPRVATLEGGDRLICLSPAKE